MSHFYFLGNTTNSQLFGCILQSGGKTVVIDGGMPDDYKQLESILRSEQVSCIDAWFFTHPHHDHIGAFCSFCENVSDMEINMVYFNFPKTDFIIENCFRSQSEVELWKKFDRIIEERFSDKIHTVRRGEVFEFSDITVNVLRVFNEKITENLVNNSSSVYRFDVGGRKTLLVLGDIGIEAGEEVMKLCTEEELEAAYTQLSHHGQKGASKEFYLYIKPKRCLWGTPLWLWDNHDENGVAGKGRFKTLETRQWMKEIGVTEHFIAKDGTVKIEL